MMERVRILLVAAPTAPVRGLAVRLRDPDLDVLVAASAKEALDHVSAGVPDVVVVDGSLPGREVFRLYGRLRSTAPGAAVPVIFTAHDRSQADAAPTTAPDFYLPPEAPLEQVEQLVFSFLPASFVDEEAEAEQPYDDPYLPEDDPVRSAPTYGPHGRLQGGTAVRAPRAPAEPPKPPFWSELIAQLQTGTAAIGLAYLGIYLAAEVLAALDPRLGLVVQGGLLLAALFHGANVPPGPERTFFWTFCLAPLTRIYGLAQPYAGAPPVIWWAFTAIPMVVAGIVAMRVPGLTARECGLIPRPRDIPVAIFMAPVGLAIGVILFMLLDPRALGRELALWSVSVVAFIVVLNPGIVEEIVFRGVLQRAVTSVLGSSLGVLYTALLYAPVLPAGLVSGGSLLGVGLTFAIGLLLSFVTLKTGSIFSATVGHIGIALGLFVIGPYLVPGSLAPAGPESRLPTPKPALVGSPTPAQAAPPTLAIPAPKPTLVQQPTTGASSPTAQQPSAQTPAGQPSAGQPPAGQPTPTPFSLAPPLPTPTPPQPTAPPAPPPGSTATIPGQIVVVRGTGGSGARLRSQPGSNGPIITVIPEYTPLVVIGQDRIVDGTTWRNVRSPNGAEGWVAASFVTTG
ncbi:MAG: SH3 domain-containing protein [Chloroflexi bacterium]|nr:SH3 domain-containing protein [Chloroflexota bacterium]